MDIKEFIEMFITTYRLLYNAKTYSDKEEFIFSLEDNRILEIYNVEDLKNLEIYLWILGQDEMLLNILEKIYKKNPEIFSYFNDNTYHFRKCSRIMLNKTESNLEWFNELVKRD